MRGLSHWEGKAKRENGPTPRRHGRHGLAAGFLWEGNGKSRGTVSVCLEGRDFPLSLFYFPLSVSPYAAGATKRRECKYEHDDGVNDGETQQPSGRAGMPLTPSRDRAVEREHAENCSGGFMKKLARRAPDNAQGDFRRVPERRIEACSHATILVHILLSRCPFGRILMFLIAFEVQKPERTAR